MLENLKDLDLLIQKATIAKNRYVSTRQASYLEYYDDAAKQTNLKIALLKQDINHPHQQRRLASLSPLLKKNFNQIEQTSNLSMSEEIDLRSQRLSQQEAKKLTHEIDVILSQLENTENALLQRSPEELAKTHNSILTFTDGICLNFLILTGVYYLTYRDGDRHPSETALQEWDFTDAILHTVGALVVVLDPQGRIIRFNRACEQITGYSLAQVKGKYFWELFSIPTEAQTAKKHWEKLLASESSNEYENYLLTHQGSRRRITWSNTTLGDRTGAVEYAIATGIDITEHSFASEALRSSEQHLRNVINSLFTFVAVLTPDGTLIEANQALLEAASLQPQDVLGLPLTETYWWSYSFAVQAQMQTTIERVSGGKRVRYEVEEGNAKMRSPGATTFDHDDRCRSL